MRTPVLAGIVAALVLLPGCAAAAGAAPSASVPATSVASSSAPAASNQSKLDACNELAATMEDAAKTLNDSMKVMSSDPAKAVTALSSFNTSLEAAVAKVSNPEVKAQGEKAVAAIKELIDALDVMVKNPADAKPETVSGALAKMTTELSAIGTVCAA